MSRATNNGRPQAGFERMARIAALSTLLILGLAGCGGNDETPEIRSFEIALLSPSVARVSYDLTDPARLALDIRAVDGAESGTLPLGPPGTQFGSLTMAPRMPAGRGTIRVRFEQGEFDFTQPDTLRFQLLAVTTDGRRSRSDPITKIKPGH
jgi:hypothetical protein